MADLVAVMRDGALQQVGSPEEIYERPANRFVALFVGSPPMNLLRASIDDAGLHVAGMTLPLGASRRAACAGKAIGEVGIRPEDVVLAQPGCLDPRWRGLVVEPMGNETLVVIRLGEERLSARARRGFRRPVGSAIGVSFDADDACFFDAAGTTVVHRDTRKEETK